MRYLAFLRAINVGGHHAVRKSPLAAEAHAAVMAFRDDVHDFHVRGREIYWHARERPAILRLTGSKMERALGGPATFRNITTVRKLAELVTSH